MSVTEIKAKLTQLSVEEPEALRQTVEGELARKQTSAPANMEDHPGFLPGTVTFLPGWDDDEK